jgi:signal transduction histidine kinase
MLGLAEGGIVFPIFFGGNMMGITIFGGKRGGDPYNLEDITLMRTVLNTVASALANAYHLEKLENQTRMLVQSEKMVTVGTLASGIGHEIKNPLHTISLSAMVVESMMEPPELSDEDRKVISKSVDSIQQAVRRATEVINNLTQFIRPGDTTISPFNIHEGLDQTLSLLGHLMKDRIMVHKEYCENGWVEALGSEPNQIFMNLLVNATHAIEGNGEIWIKTEREGSHLTISIKDSGRGISKEHLSQIFDPFFTTKDPQKGTGLGLFIVNQIVARHQGRIEVESEGGMGTTFLITLPVKLNSTGG